MGKITLMLAFAIVLTLILNGVSAAIINDPDAKALLKRVKEGDPGWDGDFPGFKATIEVFANGKTYRGQVIVRDRKTVEVSVPNSDAEPWARQTIAAIAATAFREDFETRYQNVGVTFGPDDLNPLGQLLQIHGDRIETGFRVKGNEIRQIFRENSTTTVTIDVLHVQRDSLGRKVGQSFAVQYFDKKTKELKKTETVQEAKVEVGGYLLPDYYYEVVNEKGGPKTRTIRFLDHKLLDQP